MIQSPVKSKKILLLSSARFRLSLDWEEGRKQERSGAVVFANEIGAATYWEKKCLEERTLYRERRRRANSKEGKGEAEERGERGQPRPRSYLS